MKNTVLWKNKAVKKNIFLILKFKIMYNDPDFMLIYFKSGKVQKVHKNVAKGIKKSILSNDKEVEYIGPVGFYSE